VGFIERERERERERDREGETEREILSMYAGPKVLRTKYKETLMGAVATYACCHITLRTIQYSSMSIAP
jgi:hypothetical protein